MSNRFSRFLMISVALGGLSACSTSNLDWDLRGLTGGSLDTRDAALQATQSRPRPDGNGVLSYPGYQVVVARRGDTVRDVANRIGTDPQELARYNALKPDDLLRADELLALPRRVEAAQMIAGAGPPGGTASGAIIGGPIATTRLDVTSVASGALDRAAGSAPSVAPPAPAATQPARHQVKRGETGAIFASLTAERAREMRLGIVRGAVVADVAPGWPAERAGLRDDDVVTRIQGRPVANAGSVNATVGVAAPGSSLNVVYLRAGHEATTALTVATPVEGAVHIGADRVLAYGATLRDLDGEVQVVAVEGGSAAAQGELIAGDIITSVGGAPVADARAAAEALRGSAGATAVEARRNGDTVTVNLEIPLTA